MSESDIGTKTLSQRDFSEQRDKMMEISDDPFADIAQDFEVNDQVYSQTQFVVIDPDQAHGLLANIYPAGGDALVRHTVALNALAERAAAAAAGDESRTAVIPEWVIPKVKTRTYVPDLNEQNNRIRFVSRGIIPLDAEGKDVAGSLTTGRATKQEGYIFPKQKSLSESLLAPDMARLDLRPEQWIKLAPDVAHSAIVSGSDQVIRVPSAEYGVVMDYTENGKILNEIRVEQTRADPEFVITGFAVVPPGSGTGSRALKRAKHHDRGVSSMDDIVTWYNNNYSPERIVADNKKCAKTLRQLQTLMRMHGYDERAITMDMIRKLQVPLTVQVQVALPTKDWEAVKRLYREPKMPKPSELRKSDNGRYYYQGILTDYINATKRQTLPEISAVKKAVPTVKAATGAMAMVDGEVIYRAADGKYYDAKNYGLYQANQFAAMLESLVETVKNDRNSNKGSLARSLDSITYRGVKRAGTYDRPMITEDNAGAIVSQDDKVYQLLKKLDMSTPMGRTTFVQLVDMFRTIGKVTISNGQYVTSDLKTHICCTHELYNYRYDLSGKSDEDLLELDFAVFRGGETLCKYCEKVLSEFQDIGASFSAGSQILQITGRSMLLGKDVTIGKEDTELYKFLMTVCRELRISPMSVSAAYDFIMRDRPIAAGVFGDVQYIELFQILNIGGVLDEETTQRVWTRLQTFIKNRTVPAIAARMIPFVKSLQNYIDDIEDDTPTEVTKSYTAKLQAIYAMYMIKECLYRTAVLVKMAQDVVPAINSDDIIRIYNAHCRQMKALCLAGLRDRNADVQTINKFAAIFGIELTAEKVKHLLPVFTQDKSLADYLDAKIQDITLTAAAAATQTIDASATEEDEDTSCVPYLTDTMHGFYSGRPGGKYLVALRNRFQRGNEFDRANIGGVKSKTSVNDYLKKYEPVVDGEKTAYEDMINRKVQTEKDMYMTTIGYVADFAGGETVLSNPPKQMQNLPHGINTGYKNYTKNQGLFSDVVESFDLAHPLPDASPAEPIPDMLSLKKYMTNPTHRKDTQIPYVVIPPKDVKIIESVKQATPAVKRPEIASLEGFVLGGHPLTTNDNLKSITGIRSWIESQIDQQRILVSNLKQVVPNAVKEDKPMIKTTNRDFIRFNRIQSLGKQLVSIHQSLVDRMESSIIYDKLGEIYSPADYADFKLRWYKPMANHGEIYTAAYGTEGITTDLVFKAVMCDIYAHAVKIRTGSEDAVSRGFDILTMHMGSFNLSDNISIHNRYLNFVSKIFEIIEGYMDILDVNHTVMDDQEYKHYYRAVKITAPRKLDILERKDAEPDIPVEEVEPEDEPQDDILEDEDDYDSADGVQKEGDREEEEDAVGDYDNEFGNADEAGEEMELDDRD